MLFLQAGALILGAAVVVLLFLLDQPEDLGRMPHHWVRRQKGGER